MKINGAGTIERRGKAWRIRFNLGADSVTQKYRYSPWRTVHGTKADALAALAEYRQEIEGGLKLDADKTTFAEFAEWYLSQRRAQGSFAPATLTHDSNQIKILNRLIGESALNEIDAITVSNINATLGSQGRPAGAVARAFAVLKKILKAAVDNDMILRNPCDKVRPPKTSKPDIHFLSEKEASRLTKALDEVMELTEKKGTDAAGLIVLRSRAVATRLALLTGARRGEVLGLTWSNVSFEDESIRIIQQQTQDGIRTTKTDRAKRIITLDEKSLGILRWWKDVQAEYLQTLGIDQEDSTPVVTDELSGFHDPDNFSRWWRAFTKSNGFDGLRFHDLRHTQATLLIAQGVDIKTVQARLGHEKASTTLDIYAGVMPGKDREAAMIVGGLLNG